MGCDDNFVSVSSFDDHRVGPHCEEFAPGRFRPSPERRCLTAQELIAAGWGHTPKGWRNAKGVRWVAQNASRRGKEAA